MSTKSTASLKAPSKPLASLQGYHPKLLASDMMAGIVIAALSIPIAMGYADICGLPPEYGLYASLIAPLTFAFVTGTKNIVFGMDSAASAITGSMLATIGIALGSGLCIQVMPLLTLMTAAFLLLFSAVKAGRIIRLIPMPVMHGFISGISLSVIITQIPLLIGTKADTSGPFWTDVVNVFATVPSANIPSTLLAIGCFACIIMIKKFAPKVPGALVALVAAALATSTLSLSSMGVVTLNPVSAGLPHPELPDFAAFDVVSLLFAALAIALTVALESLLCLETFSIKAGMRSNGNRELASFGLANIACALFGCPPCSASISRTAASMSSGGVSQMASVFSALVVGVVVLFCGPALQFLPRAALASIVTIALIEVCDFAKINRYARHMKSEFTVFLVSFAMVILFGAIPGIISGFIIAVAISTIRNKRASKEELMGVVPYGHYKMPQEMRNTDPGIKYQVFKFEGELSFLNVDAAIDRLIDNLEPDTRAVIIKLSAVTSLDTTATDKILQLLDMLHARNIYVKLVRKVRPTNESYTRFELRTIMHRIKFYPNVRSCLVSLKRQVENGESPQRASDWLEEPHLAAPNEGEPPTHIQSEEPLPLLEGDRPVLTVRGWEDVKSKKGPKRVVNGEVAYIQSQVVLLFDASFNPTVDYKDSGSPYAFDTLIIFRESTGDALAEYDSSGWEWITEDSRLDAAVSMIDEYVKRAIKDALEGKTPEQEDDTDDTGDADEVEIDS